MYALSQATRAYGAAATPTRTDKSVEYEAVARITRRLQQATKAGPAGFGALAEALHDNKRLWTIFATDVADTRNTLPGELKARLFYLAEFTLQHTPKVLSREATVMPLIDINTAVLRGLRNGVE